MNFSPFTLKIAKKQTFVICCYASAVGVTVRTFLLFIYIYLSPCKDEQSKVILTTITSILFILLFFVSLFFIWNHSKTSKQSTHLLIQCLLGSRFSDTFSIWLFSHLSYFFRKKNPFIFHSKVVFLLECRVSYLLFTG